MPDPDANVDHILPMMRGMEKPWRIAGYAFLVLSVVVTVLLYTNFPFGPTGQTSPNGKTPEIGPKQTPLAILTIFLWIVSSMTTFGWMVADIMDRRSNYRWLLAFMPCCALGLQPMLLGLYLYVGRKTAQSPLK